MTIDNNVIVGVFHILINKTLVYGILPLHVSFVFSVLNIIVLFFVFTCNLSENKSVGSHRRSIFDDFASKPA